MIGISAIEQDLDGAVVLDLDPTPRKSNLSRLQRTATLDGGAVINHMGYADGDRTLTVKGAIEEDQEDVLWDLFRAGSMVNVATCDGFFRAAIERLDADAGDIYMSIMIGERLSE